MWCKTQKNRRCYSSQKSASLDCLRELWAQTNLNVYLFGKGQQPVTFEDDLKQETDKEKKNRQRDRQTDLS